ncbi:hypothetical protein PENTCL1PPCAC_20079, partial [Pristionchus entomophagus]
QDECSFQYRAEYRASFAREEAENIESPSRIVMAMAILEGVKTAKVTELGSRALKEGGAYRIRVATKVDQMNTRELREQERFMVEGLARMAMIGGRRKLISDDMPEALQEWIEDAERLLALNDQDLFFSVVSEIHRD